MATAADAGSAATGAETLLSEVFDAVSGVRRAYAALQGAHCPWDPDKMRSADAAVVAELRHLARLRDRFRRSAAAGGRVPPRPAPPPPLREAVAPYEAALDDLRRQLQAKQAEVDGLKDKLAARRNGRHHPSSKPNATTPTAELFVSCAEQARAATRAFAGQLLHLMRAAGLDPASTTRSLTKIPVSSPHLAKHALEAHVTRALLGGFEHESFYLDGSLSSLLDPAAFRRERYTQFRDMRGMEPAEMLGVLPTCAFGRYAASKFTALLSPKVEEAILGDGEHRKVVNGGAHPRTPFYGEFLRAAKAVWMLHLLAFALELPPSHFDAGRGRSSTRSTWRASPARRRTPAPAWSSASLSRPVSAWGTAPSCAPGSSSCRAADDRDRQTRECSAMIGDMPESQQLIGVRTLDFYCCTQVVPLSMCNNGWNSMYHRSFSNSSIFQIHVKIGLNTGSCMIRYYEVMLF